MGVSRKLHEKVGTVKYWPSSTLPAGWLKANGAAISRTTYAALFAELGTIYGNGDNVTTFNIPDLRGEFVRGWDDGRGVDSGRAIATAQGDENKLHAHDVFVRSDNTMSASAVGGYGASGPIGILGSNGGTTAYRSLEPNGSRIVNTAGSEARPRNIAMMAIIKY